MERGTHQINYTKQFLKLKDMNLMLKRCTEYPDREVKIRPLPKNIIVKLQNIWDKEKILKVSRGDRKTGHLQRHERADFLMLDAKRK